MKEVSGTKEWSVKSVNLITGCRHNCRYCYARFNAVKRFKTVETLVDWEKMNVRPHDVQKRHSKYNGRVMFPTTHDIVPEFLEECTVVLRNLLKAGNEVLVVSKPHFKCIEKICDEFEAYKDQILFRFTIGSYREHLREYWEPGAPTFHERMLSLGHAYERGFQTSVSIEPMLDSAIIHTAELVRFVKGMVTDTIWLGKLNQIDQRVLVEDAHDEAEVLKIKKCQSDDEIKLLYHRLQWVKKIRWKESIKEVVGVPLAEEAGKDE